MSFTQQVEGYRQNATKIRFKDIKKPGTIFCMFVLNGGGTKLYHSYLDGHPEIYHIPCYPLIYLYPHWDTWKEKYADQWNWLTIIDLLCKHHASLLDSRRILGMNGLDALGPNRDEHIEIDEKLFRSYLLDLLEGEPVDRKTFLFAVHYAYALARGEDIEKKKVFFWHHHEPLMLEEFVKDVPEAIVIGAIRDARPKVYRNLDSVTKQDEIKLRATDQMIRKSKIFNFAIEQVLLIRYLDLQDKLCLNKILFFRHEDLALDLEGLMKGTCDLLNITFQDSMMETTFDGKLWWGHSIYSMPQTTGTYMRVVSREWQKEISKVELFAIEGATFSFCKKYGYDPILYTSDSFLNKVLLVFAILLPFGYSWNVFFSYLNPLSHVKFIQYALKESQSRNNRKDYSTSSTYRYKWVFRYLNLWKERWYERLLDYAEGMKEKGERPVISKMLVFIGRTAYVSAKCLHYWLSFLSIPLEYIKRLCFFYRCLYWRLSNKLYLAPLVGWEDQFKAKQ